MAKNSKKTVENNLVKTDWMSSFNLVGEARVNDFTFKIDEKSEKSDWVYNAINLGVDCGEKYGTVYCELMNGYGSERDNVVYVFGKNEDGSADFTNSYTIAWEDRFDEDILDDIPNLLFTTVGLEKTDKDKTYYKKFLTGYDAIAYMNEHLEDGMVVNIKGQMRYTLYNGNLQCRKEIRSIVLSSQEPEKYHATFIQTMLLDKNSCTKESLDKEKSALMVDGYILEKFKEYNGYDLTDNGKIKGGQFVPLKKTFEFPVDLTTDRGKTNIGRILNKIFKVKKGVTQITFNGNFVEKGATVKTTVDDLPDEMKAYIDMGIMSEEDALAECAAGGSRERKMILTYPFFKKVGDEEDAEKVPMITEEKFEEEDLLLDCLIPKKDEDVDNDDEFSFDEDEDEDNVFSEEDDWLNAL